ncbi:hypothetical protein MMC13_005908 [Lambiella insularis]|nr:hypothetical protein [Lambiella insularis]
MVDDQVPREELRVALRYQSLNVPETSTDRAKRVANDFAIAHLQRPFTYETDFIHLPPDFDCTERKNIWVLCDFNIQNQSVSVDKIPVESWKVTYNPERQSWVFSSVIKSDLTCFVATSNDILRRVWETSQNNTHGVEERSNGNTGCSNKSFELCLYRLSMLGGAPERSIIAVQVCNPNFMEYAWINLMVI